MKLSEPKKNPKAKVFIIVAIILVVLVILFSSTMINITVLDSEQLTNLTLQINIT